MLTKEQKIDGVKQALSFARDKEDLYAQGVKEAYVSVSLREVLYVLGYEADEADEIIEFCASRGFDYCIDPMIRNTRSGEKPERFACVWGIDQLRSRLEWVI